MSENNKKKATDKKPTKDQQKIKKLENKIIELNKEIEDIKLNASKVINEFKNNSKNVQEQYESDYKYRSKSLLEDIIKHIDIFESALFPNKDVSPEFKN